MRMILGPLVSVLSLPMLFLLGCEDSKTVPAPELYPLAEGNVWNYTGGRSDTVMAREIIDGKAYYRFNSGSSFGLVRLNDTGQLMLLFPCCGETVLFDFEAQVGESWVLDDCMEHFPYEVTLFGKGEVVSVPVGRFTGCYRFYFASSHYLVCPGVGLVAVEDTAGSYAHELSGYRLKDPDAPPSISENLLVNGSFERICCPTFQGWTVVNSIQTSSATDTPEDGGCWSLQLTADWAPTTAILRQKIQGVTDGDVLRLSAHIRAEDPDGGGMIALLVGQTPWAAPRKWAYSGDPQWAPISLVDTLSMNPGDSVWVELSAFPTEITARTGLFDSVVLEKVKQ